MWTNNGTITVVTGSRYVEGQGTQFVGPVIAGYALLTGDLRLYEIEAVESATRLRLVRPYQGGGAANVPYDVVPVSPDVTGLIERIQALIDRYQSFRDTVGQGMFPSGTEAAPGVRGVSDQSTGLIWPGGNVLGMITGGMRRFTVDGEGAFVSGRRLAINGSTISTVIHATNVANWSSGIPEGANRWAVTENQFGVEMLTVTSAGNLLVGVTSASNHVIARGTVEGELIMQVQGKAHPGVAFFSAASGSANGSACAFALNKNSQTGRSINAAGTINGSGADYAEYMLKAAGCGIIAKGDVCGVDRDGRLTKTWADAISFVVKSTDPSLVGGDTWAAHLPPQPEQEEDETDEAFAAREAEWSAALEQARQCVDRIAFCGQVPCNVTGDFEVGDYIVAAASGAGIKAVAMKLDDMTMAQYARRIGKVWAIRDGRAWVDVQHG